jgi:WD40 repeat protein
MRSSAVLIAAICCFPSGKLVAQTIRERDCHAGPVAAVAFTPDSQRIVTAGFDGTVCQDTFAGHAPSQSLHKAKILALAVSSDGQQWAAGHVDGKVVLGSALDAGVGPSRTMDLPPLEGRPSCVHGLVFSPDGRQLLACAEDGCVRVWDLRLQEHQTIRVGSSALYALAISPDGQTIATAGLEGTIHLVDRVSGDTRSLRGHQNVVYALQFSVDGKLLASGSGDGTVRLWDATTGKQAGCLSGHSDAVYAVGFDASGQRLLSVDKAGLVVLWDTTTWTKIYSHRLAGKILCAALSSDGRYIAAGNACGKCYLIDLARP